MIRGLLAGIGLAPFLSYKNGRNYVVIIPPKEPLSVTVKMMAAIGFSVVTGMLLNLLPDGIRSGVNALLLIPVTDAFLGLVSAVSGPLIFVLFTGMILWICLIKKHCITIKPEHNKEVRTTLLKRKK